MELVIVRNRLDEEAENLTPQERIALAQADQAIAETILPETLAEFIKCFPSYAIAKWWGEKRK